MSTVDGASTDGLAQALQEDVRAVLRLLEGSSVEELRLERGARAITVRRVWQEPAAAPAPDAGGAQEADLSRLAVPGRTEVHAQVVGVFHRAREADGPPLASEGDAVEGDKALGVVETLGIANDVLAPVRGRLAELLVEDGQPVEYGELIAVIVPE